MSTNFKKQISFILFLTIFSLSLSQCSGTMFDRTSGSVDPDNEATAAESADINTAILKKIDASGSVKIIMSVESFVETGTSFESSTFEINLNDETVTTTPLFASDYYVYDNQQIATAYSDVEFTLSGSNVVNGDIITIMITQADGGSIILEGMASSEEDTNATLITTD